MRPHTRNMSGFGLVELLVLIVVVSILIAVAMQSMTATVEDIRKAKTEREMETLTRSITGDPEKTADGSRTDFGYVGDIGAFPPNLNALRSNPGGYASWDGPYLPPDIAEDSLGYKTDEWGTPYSYSGGTVIQSTGSGNMIAKEVVRTSSDYLLNQFPGTVVDQDDNPPGDKADSILLLVTIPNGVGGYLSKSYNPDSTGQFLFDSIPVGQHPLELIYTPDDDTLHRFIHVLPRHRTPARFKFATTFGSGGGGGGCSSSGTLILRPNGVGVSSELDDTSCVFNWQCVDEVVADGDVTSVERQGSSYRSDIHALDDPASSSCTITQVTVYCRARKEFNFLTGYVKPVLYTGGTEYEGPQTSLVDSYQDYSETWSTNPSTGVAWTWSDITGLQAGVSLRAHSSSVYDAICTQIWVEVEYEP